MYSIPYPYCPAPAPQVFTQSDKINTKSDVIVKGKDGIVIFPYFLFEISNTLKPMQTNYYQKKALDMNTPFLIANATTIELEELKKSVQILPHTARNIWGNPVPSAFTNVYEVIPTSVEIHLKNITILVNPYVKEQITPLLPPNNTRGNALLSKILILANYLKIHH